MTIHCISMFWIGTAALLLTILEYLAHRRETMAQKQVELKKADSTEVAEGESLNMSAPKRKLTLEKAKELATKIR